MSETQTKTTHTKQNKEKYPAGVNESYCGYPCWRAMELLPSIEQNCLLTDRRLSTFTYPQTQPSPDVTPDLDPNTIHATRMVF